MGPGEVLMSYLIGIILALAVCISALLIGAAAEARRPTTNGEPFGSPFLSRDGGI
jgi:hypothetical protein